MRTLAAILALALPGLAGCGPSGADGAAPGGFGDPARGAALIRAAGCGACHSIPGIRGARGLVGPPLDRMARRTFIAGVLPNTPSNMIRWVREPQAILPGNAMPDPGIRQDQARDIAAYLYTLD